MTGLDKIIRQIQLDADNTCETIRSKSEAECSDVIQNAEAKASSIRSEGEREALNVEKNMIQRAESTAEIEERKILLNAKQSIVSSMVSDALEHLRNLEDVTYFDLLYKLISRYSLSADGVLQLSGKDLNRLPADFEQKVSASAKGKLSISKTPVAIDAGFVLVYGGVDVNCSFSSLFADNSERITDETAKLLFAEV